MFSQHGDKCGQQEDQKTGIHETGDSGDLTQQAFLNRWDGRGLTGDGGLIESEEDGTEKGYGLFIWIRLEVQMDINDESQADSREQTHLWEQVRYLTTQKMINSAQILRWY